MGLLVSLKLSFQKSRLTSFLIKMRTGSIGLLVEICFRSRGCSAAAMQNRVVRGCALHGG